MALLKCENCGKDISDTMAVCPHCGYERKKEQKRAETAYKGSIKDEIIRPVVPALGVILIAFVSNLINKIYLGKFLGDNAVEAYNMVQKCLPTITRGLVLLVVFALCGVASYFIVQKTGEKKTVRWGIAAVGIVVYLLIMIALTNRDVNSIVGGRGELMAYVRVMVSSIGIYCGFVYGIVETFAYMCTFGKNKTSAIIFPIIVLALYLVIECLKTILFLGVLRYGTSGIYSLFVLPVIIIASIIPYIIQNSKKRNHD